MCSRPSFVNANLDLNTNPHPPSLAVVGATCPPRRCCACAQQWREWYRHSNILFFCHFFRQCGVGGFDEGKESEWLKEKKVFYFWVAEEGKCPSPALQNIVARRTHRKERGASLPTSLCSRATMGVPAHKSPYASSRHQLVSMFGRQPASHRSTAPFTKFGTGTRDQAQNVSRMIEVRSCARACGRVCPAAHGVYRVVPKSFAV